MFIKFKATPSLKTFVMVWPKLGRKIVLEDGEVLTCNDELGNHILDNHAEDNFKVVKEAEKSITPQEASQDRKPAPAAKRKAARRKDEGDEE